MFLLASGRHVGTHTYGHQHGAHMAHILHTKKICDLNLGEGVCVGTFFLSQILDLIYSTVLTFVLIYFKKRDTQTQQ